MFRQLEKAWLDIRRKNLEWFRGRIESHETHMKLLRPDKKKEGVTFGHQNGSMIRKDNLGRLFAYVKLRSVRCYSRVEELQSDYALFEHKTGKKYVSVPQRVCKKCEHYRTGKQTGFGFPSCALRTSGNPESDAIASMTEAIAASRQRIKKEVAAILNENETE